MRGIKKQTTFAALIAVGLALPAVFLMQAVSAAAAVVYLSPGTNSVNNGSNFSVSLRVNPNGNGLDGIETTVNFDTSKVQFVSASTSGGAFGTQIQEIVSGGTIKIARGEFGAPVTTDALVETITFKAIVGSGSTSITLSGTGLTGGGAAVGATVNNATVNFTTPTTPTPTTPTTPTSPTKPSTPTKPTTPSNPSTPTTPTTPSTGNGGEQPTSTKPSVSCREDKVQFTQAGIAVETNVPTKAYIAYGLSTDALVQTATTDFATTHNVQLDPKLLLPGTTYYYKVNAVDQQGNVTESETKSFKTKGFKVVIAVFDKNKKPFNKQNLTLRSDPKEGKTDGSGFVTFDDIAPGTHTLSYSVKGKEYSQKILVDNNVQTGQDGAQTAPTQNFSAILDVVPAKSVAPLVSTIGLILALLVAAAFWYFKLRPRFANRRLAAQYVSGSTGTPVVGQMQASEKPKEDTLLSKLSRVHAPHQAEPGTIVSPKTDDTERRG